MLTPAQAGVTWQASGRRNPSSWPPSRPSQMRMLRRPSMGLALTLRIRWSGPNICFVVSLGARRHFSNTSPPALTDAYLYGEPASTCLRNVEVRCADHDFQPSVTLEPSWPIANRTGHGVSVPFPSGCCRPWISVGPCMKPSGSAPRPTVLLRLVLLAEIA